MTDHIYAAEHPESDRDRRGGFTIWLTGLSGSGKTTVAHLLGPALDECARRDVNGLYAKAFAGEIKGFTGVDDPYEAPESAEIVVDTEGISPEESAAQVVDKLEELGLVPAKVTA